MILWYLSSLFLKISYEGDSTVSLDNLLQCFPKTLKKIFKATVCFDCSKSASWSICNIAVL